MTTQPAVPGTVLRPLVEPVALFPWAMMWRAGSDHPGLRALNEAVDELAVTEEWLLVPDDAWFPNPKRASRPDHPDRDRV